MLFDYLKSLHTTSLHGDAREESFYSDLKQLLKLWIQNQNKQFDVITLPRKTEGGNPDFRIWDGKSKIVGYIEAKAPTVGNLDEIAESEQLKRYRQTFPNLILTNFLEFRLYRNGVLIAKTEVGRPFVLQQLKAVPPVENETEFGQLLDQFFSFSIPRTFTAKQLATELAKRTRFLRDNVIAEEMKEEKIEGTQTLEAFLEAFKQHLLSTLTVQDFANLFAQTITYGLFAARTRANKEFNRPLAYQFIPHTIGILRDVFKFISLGDLPPNMEWIIDDIAEVLANCDVNKIINNFYQEGKGRDPVIHFYETFLSEYDPKEREKRGVYYTPEPVVSYITRSIHHLLKTRFGRADGFASDTVTVLDPAAGTITFPVAAIRLAVEEYKNKYGSGGVSSLIHDHILKHFFAFELMMAPYAVGHLKAGITFDELGYRLKDDERFQLYLTNTLEWKDLEQSALPGLTSLSHESELAGKVKREIPIMVVMGNPPYSGHSDNNGEWIAKEIREYFQVDGHSLNERNPKWLQDDYVKFIRFAQWKIDQAGEGILGFITNHSYLDNPTFRGMRQSLMTSFDELYILNLHGNSLKKEKCPDGSKDENVFDIQAGVAIALFVKMGEKK